MAWFEDHPIFHMIFFLVPIQRNQNNMMRPYDFKYHYVDIISMYIYFITLKIFSRVGNFRINLIRVGKCIPTHFCAMLILSTRNVDSSFRKVSDFNGKLE